ncbi:MAG: cytochrome c biogenesis protein CcsA [Armatimonadetes bacterium]|nr:cytochrome c biogenesis protein CcsA [Armatimonadota bacterium]
MHLGNVLLVVMLTVTLSAVAAYVAAGIGRREYIGAGRAAYIASTVLVSVISVYFMALILGNHFELEYIFNNSSKALSTYYKVSVFWAGQQGSFLFWALCAGLLGIFVMLKAREFEPWLMTFWSSMQGLFLILLLIDSPFKLTQAGMEIADGQGLRELLQNPWMAIHPPLVFIGYAAMSVPAAFAIAALIKGQFGSWCRTTLVWTVFGWITLGAGIIVGAYWAYEVLGWGGYWGWDPVENASLIPWLTGTALLHGMVAERYRGSFKRANIIMALITFLFVFYATFLTRSDALKDFSVHTFGDARIGGPLMFFMGLFLIVSAALSIWRWKAVQSKPSFTTIKSKDFAIFLAIITLTASAMFVFVGTSAPIIGKMASHVPVLNNIIPAQVKVDQAFYNRTNAPIILIVLTLMALAPIVAWRRENVQEDQQGWGVIIAALVVGLSILALRLNLMVFAVAIAIVALAGLITNAYHVARTCKFGLRLIGGFAAHVGMGILFLGVIFSAAGGKAKTIALVKGGKPVSSHGYTFTYNGTKDLASNTKGMMIRVDGNGRTVKAMPTMQITRDKEVMAKPHIVKSFGRDLYIAPKSIPGPEEKVLARGDSVQVQDFQLKFVDFTPHDHEHNHAGPEEIGAKLDAMIDGKKVSVAPVMEIHRGTMTKGAVDVPGMDAKIGVDRISVEERAVQVTVFPEKGKLQTATLRRDQKVAAGEYELTFNGWRLPDQGHAGGMQVIVSIGVNYRGKTVTVEPVYEPGQSADVHTVSKPIAIPGADATIKLDAVDFDSGRVLVTVTSNTETAVVDVSVKPFISLLWIGSILALLGAGIAMWRRNAESYEKPVPNAEGAKAKRRER